MPCRAAACSEAAVDLLGLRGPARHRRDHQRRASVRAEQPRVSERRRGRAPAARGGAGGRRPARCRRRAATPGSAASRRWSALRSSGTAISRSDGRRAIRWRHPRPGAYGWRVRAGPADSAPQRRGTPRPAAAAPGVPGSASAAARRRGATVPRRAVATMQRPGGVGVARLEPGRAGIAPAQQRVVVGQVELAALDREAAAIAVRRATIRRAAASAARRARARRGRPRRSGCRGPGSRRARCSACTRGPVGGVRVHRPHEAGHAARPTRCGERARGVVARRQQQAVQHRLDADPLAARQQPDGRALVVQRDLGDPHPRAGRQRVDARRARSSSWSARRSAAGASGCAATAPGPCRRRTAGRRAAASRSGRARRRAGRRAGPRAGSGRCPSRARRRRRPGVPRAATAAGERALGPVGLRVGPRDPPGAAGAGRDDRGARARTPSRPPPSAERAEHARPEHARPRAATAPRARRARS